MTIDDRDRAIIQLAARFGQLTSAQIFELVFDTSSRTPCNRALHRLVGDNYLTRIERRLVGGARGGSGQYVFALGAIGHRMYRAGRYSPLRAINYHSLAIVDSFLTIVRLARAGEFSISGYSTEPDCHVTIAQEQLKPDMYVELERSDGRQRKIWFEVDMGSEGQRQLKYKLMRYWRAYQRADTAEWPVFPLVLLVAVDEARERELRWLLRQASDEQQAIFELTTVAKLPTALR